MRVLLDNNVNQKFARLISAHEVRHVRELGWAEIENGELIRTAEVAGFETFITADKNMQYQQGIAERWISVIVLNSLFIKWEHIAPLSPKVQMILDHD